MHSKVAFTFSYITAVLLHTVFKNNVSDVPEMFAMLAEIFVVARTVSFGYYLITKYDYRSHGNFTYSFYHFAIDSVAYFLLAQPVTVT